MNQLSEKKIRFLIDKLTDIIIQSSIKEFDYQQLKSKYIHKIIMVKLIKQKAIQRRDMAKKLKNKTKLSKTSRSDSD